MLLTEEWQLIATNGAVLVQKSNKSSVSLCYADGAPTTESTFGLDTRDPTVFPVATLPGRDLYAKASKSDSNCTLTVEEVRKDSPASAGIVTTDYTGSLSIPADKDRQYFFIQVKAQSATIKFGDGSGSILIDPQGYYEPLVAPAGAIDIDTTGSFVLAMG